MVTFDLIFISLVWHHKGGPHLACGDVGISPYRRLSGERDARGSVRVRVCGCGVLRGPDVFLCRVVPCRVVGGVFADSVAVTAVVLCVVLSMSETTAETVGV